MRPRRRSPAEVTTPKQGQSVSAPAGSTKATIADGSVRPPKCGALTDACNWCARPPEPGSKRCALHQDRP
jgi:hypothetical protein